MDKLLDYTLYGIEAQYKQGQYYKEAREYRLFKQVNLENKKRKSPNSLGRSIRVFGRLLVSHG